jgi:hypothetical protein
MYQDHEPKSYKHHFFYVAESASNVFDQINRVIALCFKLSREGLNGPTLAFRLRHRIEARLLESFLPDPLLILHALEIHICVRLKKHE